MDMIQGFLMAALAPLQSLTLKIWAVLPAVAASLLLLLVGAFAGHWLRYLTEHAFRMLNVDDYVRRVGLSNIIARLGLGPHLTPVAGVVVYAIVLLAFILGAAEAMGLPIVSDYLHRVVAFCPRLISAVLVMGGGLYIGDLAGRIVHRAAEANRIRGSEALVKITHGILVIFSGIIALETLGIDVRVFFTDFLQILVAAVGLGCAIAFGVSFGMAGRDSAEKWIRDLTPKGGKGSSNDAPEHKMRVVR